jgi:flagellar basal body-associated protein FliL
MLYYKDASSSNLKPVLLVVSVITAILFGAAYFAYSSSSHAHDENAAAPTNSSAAHSHV